MDLGNKYIKERNYSEAILAFEKVIDIDENNVKAKLGLVEAYHELIEIYEENLTDENTLIELIKDAYRYTQEKEFLDKLKEIENRIAYKSEQIISNEGTNNETDNNNELSTNNKNQTNTYEVVDNNEEVTSGDTIIDDISYDDSFQLNIDAKVIFTKDERKLELQIINANNTRKDNILTESLDYNWTIINNDTPTIGTQQSYIKYEITNQTDEGMDIERVEGSDIITHDDFRVGWSYGRESLVYIYPNNYSYKIIESE